MDDGLPLGRWALVGSRQEAVARRKRQTTPAATRALAVEGDCPNNTRGSGLLASRSRPHQQPSQEPQGALQALPHAARPAGASATPPLHAVPAQSPQRPVSGSVSVAGGERRLCSIRSVRVRQSHGTKRMRQCAAHLADLHEHHPDRAPVFKDLSCPLPANRKNSRYGSRVRSASSRHCLPSFRRALHVSLQELPSQTSRLLRRHSNLLRMGVIGAETLHSLQSHSVQCAPPPLTLPPMQTQQRATGTTTLGGRLMLLGTAGAAAAGISPEIAIVNSTKSVKRMLASLGRRVERSATVKSLSHASCSTKARGKARRVDT